MNRMGGVELWLNLHIALSLMGLTFVLVHAGMPYRFRYDEVLDKGFAGLTTWMLILVSGSGVFGRYLHRGLPRTHRSFGYWRPFHFVVTGLLFLLAVAHMATFAGFG